MARKRLRKRRISKTLKQDNSDEISQLPDVILQHILFFLPIQDAAMVSTLSKTWRRVWNSLPVFNFCFDQSLFAKDKSQNQMGMQEFVTMVNESLSPLQYQKAKIESFALSMSLSQEGLASDIDNWVCLVMRNYVRELSISIENLRYSLPQATFASKSLVKLNLEGCKLPESLVADAAESNCLKELSLLNVVAKDCQVQKLINCFRSLRKLILMMRTVIGCLVLDNFSKLEYVAAGVEVLKVDAPDLQTLILGGHHELHASSCTVNIKELWCVYVSSPIPSANFLQELVSKFPVMESLCLVLSENQRFKIQHCHLKTLYLYGRLEGPMEVEIDAPKLSELFCSGSVYPSLCITSASIKECEALDVHIHRVGRDILDGSHIHQLGKCLQNFNPSIEVYLHNLHTENFLTLAQLQEQEVISRPSNIKKLVLSRVSASSDYTSFLDGLFWTCHPCTLLIRKCSVNGDNFIKFLCRELLGRQENPTCCRGSEDNPSKCWRHFLKSVEIVYFTNSCESEESICCQSCDLSEILIICDTEKEVEFIFEWLEDPVCSSCQEL